MICAIVLAAGQSRRMGTQKLLLPFGGQRGQPGGTVISHIVDEILRSPVGRTFVVVSKPDAARIIGALDGRRLTVVTNPDADGDMLSSVRCGLRALPAERGPQSRNSGCSIGDPCQAVLVALGDQPAITAELIARMLDAYRLGSPIAMNRDWGPLPTAGLPFRGILVPVHAGRRGHPLLFATRYRHEILAGYDQVGLRGLLGAHPEDVFELPVAGPGAAGAAVLADMDYPEDYRRELARRTE